MRTSATNRKAYMLFAGLAAAGVAPTDALAQPGCEWSFVTGSGPSARRSHSMVYDSGRGVVVLWGGRHDPLYYDDTWEWDGQIWTLAAAGGGPGGSLGGSGAAATFDSGRNVMVVHGGKHASGRHGSTWEWNGTVWQLAAGTAGGPGFRDLSAMAYDSVRGFSVLFGGTTPGNVIRGDTWEYNGVSWMQMTAPGPAARYGHAMVYDEARGMVVLFGGFDGAANFNDTWGWDGQAWALLSSSGPAARRYPAMVYDADRQVIVMFGGHDGANALGDTHEWDGSTWVEVSASSPLGARYWMAMAWMATGTSLLHGGHDTATAVTLEDTWGYDCGGTACYANCDGSTVEPILNVDDFTCFINEFASAQALPHEQQLTHYANCDESTVAPALNVDDFTCFINAFAAGCR